MASREARDASRLRWLADHFDAIDLFGGETDAGCTEELRGIAARIMERAGLVDLHGLVRDPREEALRKQIWDNDGHVSRREDMSPRGRLELISQRDGDMIVVAIPDPSDHMSGGRPASVEFCSCGSGGGKSPKTLAALRDLALAMAEDNADHPTGKGA